MKAFTFYWIRIQKNYKSNLIEKQCDDYEISIRSQLFIDFDIIFLI